MSSIDSKKHLTHLDEQGTARMVDVGDKPVSHRVAIAEGWVYMSETALVAIRDGQVTKGDVLTVARIAGIMAGKQTSNLIPLCHPLQLSKIDVDASIHEDKSAVYLRSTAKTNGQTGVEMEALTAVTVAALTVYDMAKALDRTMRLEGIRLLEKRGGASGIYQAKTLTTDDE